MEEEEEAAPFEQGSLQYNLDSASLGCLQGKVCDEGEGRLFWAHKVPSGLDYALKHGWHRFTG